MASPVTDTYQHAASLTSRYVQYDRHLDCISTVYRHPTNMDAVGGNPCLLVFHAGSWVSVSWDQDLLPPASNGFVANRGQQAIAVALLNPAYGYGSTKIDPRKPSFTLISCEYPQGVTGSATVPSIPPQTHPSYGYWGDQRYIGRAVQYYRDNAYRWGINPNLIYTFGQSAGSCNSMVNLLSPSLPFSPNHRGGGRWDRYSSSRVRGHVNFFGEITCVANELDYGDGSNANPATVNAGLWGTKPTAYNDYAEHTLIPLTTQKRSSPLHLLKLKKPENKGLSLLSVYATSELTSNSGHDPRQLPVLDRACKDAEVNHIPILTATNSTADLGAQIDTIYPFLCGLVDQDNAARAGLAPGAF